MSAEYKVRVYDRAGALTHELTDFYALGYSKTVNAASMGIFTVHGEHAIVATIALDYQVEIWRQDAPNGIAWYCDFYGFFRDMQRSADNNGVTVATLYCPAQISRLSRPIVGYTSGTANRTDFSAVKAETIAKTLVTRNATASGSTADGRVRNAPALGISVQTDGAHGATLDATCSYQNLLTALQDIASVGGGDFDLIKTAGATWEFRWYDGQRGTDKSATVTFSMAYGNMASPSLRYATIDERTVAIVGGGGEGSLRTLVVRTGTNYAAGWNETETFVDSRQSTAMATLETAGDRELQARQARAELTFDVLQTPATLYGRDYNVGDLVTAVFAEYSATKKVASVDVGVSLQGETIRVVMADV